MNNIRKNFLTNAAFACDQYGEVCSGYLPGHVERMIKRGRIADDAETGFDALNVHLNI
jgi:hypothetical protein